jgi:acetate kinase
MKILVLNCGSSSVKYQLIEMDDEQVICRGVVERIGAEDAILRYRPSGRLDVRDVRPIRDHVEAIHAVIAALLDVESGVIQDANEIAAVGHRTVHGGEAFANSVQIDAQVIQTIADCSVFAPLHNPHNLKGIEVCLELLPDTPQVAVFDTAFHQTMPAASYLYALPYSFYQKLRVRRYGFHGTSHGYVAQRAAVELGRPLRELKVITCHLGNGASITAVQHGQSVDTSMGFTPLEGLVMGTRCGDIDPALVLYLMHALGLTPEEMDDVLNKKSGMLGLSGISHDMREIEDEAQKGNERAELALDIYCRRIKKYVGAYAAAMGGVDAIVFTGGIGENSDIVRRRVCQDLAFLGIDYDENANMQHVPWAKTKPDSPHISSGPTKVMVIPTNEELVIARDTRDILFGCSGA